MELKEYVEFVKLQVTACGILDSEFTDEQIGSIVKLSLIEIQRFIDSTKFITVPYARCIDLTDSKVSSVSRIYRTEGFTGDGGGLSSGSRVDPLYAQMWTAFTNGGTMFNLHEYVLNYATYNTLLQLKNTTTTDLDFVQDHNDNKLYINCDLDRPDRITIEYVPKIEDVNEIKSDYWIDILLKLATAKAKQLYGRARTRYTLANAQWKQDGEIILAEGNEELKTLEEKLEINSQIIYPKD